MASTNKTPNLGLNNWTENDCPKRSDFVSDNLILDNLLGNHIKDSSLHLSADEKDRVGQPYSVHTYYGTGDSVTTFKFTFSPTLVIIREKNSPSTTMRGTDYVVHSAIASTLGTSGGVVLSDKTLTAEQSETAVNGVLYNLNKTGAEYIMIAIK